MQPTHALIVLLALEQVSEITDLTAAEVVRLASCYRDDGWLPREVLR